MSIALTPRESQILRMMCAGKSAKEIAREICISHRTVDCYRNRLSQKSGCTTSAQLGVWAVRNGFVAAEELTPEDRYRQAHIDRVNQIKDRADEALDAQRVHGGQTLDEFAPK